MRKFVGQVTLNIIAIRLVEAVLRCIARRLGRKDWRGPE